MKNAILLIAFTLFSLTSFSQMSNSWFSSYDTTWTNTHSNATNPFMGNSNQNIRPVTFLNNTTDNYPVSYNNINNNNDYLNDYACYPMEARKFRYAVKSIKRKSFSDTQLRLAKQITSSNCLTVGQIKRIARVFSFETTKLEFAKFAYDYSYDPENYWMINEIFSFSSSTDELDEFLYGM